MTAARPFDRSRTAQAPKAALPGQIVLVLQGGGALGAYQVGVYEALHDAGIEPDWVIGTSIGAINAALICGNEPAHRLDRLNAFWAGVEQQGFGPTPIDPLGLAAMFGTMTTVLRGIPSFFTPNLAALRGTRAAAASERLLLQHGAAAPDAGADRLALPGQCRTRLTVNAINVCSGAMRYFDTREQPLGVRHDGVSAAAGVRRRAHRRRAVLGRRHH
jgi:NTE family protein